MYCKADADFGATNFSVRPEGFTKKSLKVEGNDKSFDECTEDGKRDFIEVILQN